MSPVFAFSSHLMIVVTKLSTLYFSCGVCWAPNSGTNNVLFVTYFHLALIMSGRLASFKGPSTPTSSPAQQQRQPGTPKSPARTTESTYHRKLRMSLIDLKTAAETWDDLVLIDGLKAVKALIDARTELEYVSLSTTSEIQVLILNVVTNWAWYPIVDPGHE